MCWERYIRGGIFGEVYSAFESWRDATMVICMQLSWLAKKNASFPFVVLVLFVLFELRGKGMGKDSARDSKEAGRYYTLRSAL